MQITTNHSLSSFGVPVILDDHGNALNYADGLRRCRYRLDLSTVQIGKHFGVSGRTVENWEQGRLMPVSALNVLSSLMSEFNSAIK